MRILFLFLLVLSFDLNAQTIAEQCPFGSSTKNVFNSYFHQTFYSSCMTGLANNAPQYPSRTFACEPHGTDRYTLYYVSQCGKPASCPVGSACSDPQPEPNCPAGQVCPPKCNAPASLMGNASSGYYCKLPDPDPNNPDPNNPDPNNPDPNNPDPNNPDPNNPDPNNPDPNNPDPNNPDPNNGGGSGGSGGGGGSGNNGGGSSSQRYEDEMQCGIGMRMDGGICKPIPANCGYINGTYACSYPEPPAGCGTINNVPGCYQPEPGCGYFNGQYGCFDADDSVSCEGGILINGVCNGGNGQGSNCPAGYYYSDFQCKSQVSNCPIGTHYDWNNNCVPDDCPEGKYSLGGVCIDIPTNPSPNPNQGNPNNGGGSGTDLPKVDLSSVNTRLDAIINSTRNNGANIVNAQNRTTSSVDNLHNTNKSILNELKGVRSDLSSRPTGGGAGTSQAVNNMSDRIAGSLDALKESLESREGQDLTEEVGPSAKSDLISETDNSGAGYLAEFESGYLDFIESEISIDNSNIGSEVLSIVPSYAACSDITISLGGHQVKLKCEVFERFKRLFGYVLYVLTVIYLFNLALKPVEAK